MIWDLAAPWLVVHEAGGVMEAYSGAEPFPLSNGIDYSTQVFPTIAAASREVIIKGREQIHLKTT